MSPRRPVITPGNEAKSEAPGEIGERPESLSVSLGLPIADMPLDAALVDWLIREADAIEFSCRNRMLTLRCTQKLLKRVRNQTMSADQVSSTRLGDWYANVVSLPYRGKSVILFMAEKSRTAVVVEGRGSAKMIPLFRERAIRHLERLNLESERVEAEARAMEEICLGKTQNRSVLGSMNDLAWSIWVAAKQATRYTDIDWDELECELNQVPLGPLNYRCSVDMTRELFGE